MVTTPVTTPVTPITSSSQQGITGRLFQMLQSVQIVCHSAALWGTVFVLMVSGCSARYDDMPAYWPIPTDEYVNYGPGRFKTTLLADQIEHFYRGASTGPIGVTTFVNIDDLYSSSTFGRMVGEQLMSELAMKGFDVIELRHSDALQFLDSSGEFALSRDVRAVRSQRTLAAIVVGTYTVSPERVYLNARLVEPSTSLVLSAGSVEMSKTKELAKLLRGGASMGSLERIPVKQVGYTSQPASAFDPIRQRWALEESDWSAPAAQSGLEAALPKIKVEPAVVNNKPKVSADSPVE